MSSKCSLHQTGFYSSAIIISLIVAITSPKETLVTLLRLFAAPFVLQKGHISWVVEITAADTMQAMNQFADHLPSNDQMLIRMFLVCMHIVY